MIRKGLTVVYVVIILLVLTLSAPKTVAEDYTTREYKIKAAFLYNFAKFVEWPEDSFSGDRSHLSVCIVGKDPFGEEIEFIKGKTVRNREVVIKRFESIEDLEENTTVLHVKGDMYIYQAF